MERLEGTGAFPRKLAAAVSAVVAVALVGNALVGDVVGNGWRIGIAMLSVALLVFARSLWVGVYLSADGVRLVTWTKKSQFDWHELRRSDAVPYDGLLTRGETGWLSMIQVTLQDGRVVRAYATAGRPRVVHRQAMRLNQMIDSHTLPTRYSP